MNILPIVMTSLYFVFSWYFSSLWFAMAYQFTYFGNKAFVDSWVFFSTFLTFSSFPLKTLCTFKSGHIFLCNVSCITNTTSFNDLPSFFSYHLVCSIRVIKYSFCHLFQNISEEFESPLLSQIYHDFLDGAAPLVHFSTKWSLLQSHF